MAAKKKPAPRKPTAAKKPASKSPAKKSAAKKPAPAKKAAPRKASGKKTPSRRPARTTRRPSTKPPARKPRAKVVRGALPEAPEALALARAIAAVAADKKAEDVVVFDTRHRAPAVGYDYLVLASGDSDRQLAAIHEAVDEVLEPQGTRAAAVEASPDWVCVTWDQGVVAHFFTPDKRETYRLEELWGDAPRVKLG